VNVPPALSGSNIEEFRATKHGLAVLEGCTPIQEAIKTFSNDPQNPNVLHDYGPVVGTGNTSMVWDIGGVAVKVSSDSTRSSIVSPTENLVLQMRFMHALQQYLEEHGKSSDPHTPGIIAPHQYFAARVPGATILVQEYMTRDYWMPLSDWMRAANYPQENIGELADKLRQRIHGALRDSALRLGVVDVVPDGQLHAENVLVPNDTQDPSRAWLCIIDQPSRGVNGYGHFLGRYALLRAGMEKLIERVKRRS